MTREARSVFCILLVLLVALGTGAFIYRENGTVVSVLFFVATLLCPLALVFSYAWHEYNQQRIKK